MVKKFVINIFTSHYLPHVGGIETYVYNFSRELKKRGYKVNVISSRSNDMPFKRVESGITVFRLSNFMILNNRFPVPYSLKEFLSVYRECYDVRTLTVINTRFFVTSLVGAIMSFFSKNKAIVIEHGSGHFYYSHPLLNATYHIYDHLMTVLLRILGTRFYGVSDAANDWLEHFGIKAKGKISNGVNVDEKTRIPKIVKSLQSKKIVFHAGRLIKEKGALELIKGFGAFASKYENYVLLIAGSGALEGRVKNLSSKSKSIFFLGNLGHTEVLGCLSKSFVYVNPSNYPEGLPTVLLEAGSLGIPVITTPNGGAKEVVKNKFNGIVIREGNEHNIKEALKFMHRYPNRTETMGRNLHKTILTNYSWPSIVNDFVIEVVENEKN
jgi:glycosyltransferase involved in cell wall biosynthesis